MAIVSCPCGARLRAKDELIGKRVKCPKCGTRFTVSAPTTEPEIIEETEDQLIPPERGKNLPQGKIRGQSQSKIFCRGCSNQVVSKAQICLKCGVQPMKGTDFCYSCGTETREQQVMCLKCGVSLKLGTSDTEKSKTTAALLCCLGFLAVAGIHRFYVGKIGTGVLWLLTAGVFFVGSIIDLINICQGKFKDKEGNLLS